MPVPEIVDRRVVAVAFPTTEECRRSLAAALGEGWQVLDIRCAPSTTDAVVLRRSSPQTLERLRSEFPTARLEVMIGEPPIDGNMAFIDVSLVGRPTSSWAVVAADLLSAERLPLGRAA